MCYGGGFFGSIILLAAGFVVLHYANKEKSQNLKIAGYILAAAGGLGLFYAAYMRFSGSCPPYGGSHNMHSPCRDHKSMMGSGMGIMGPGSMMKFSSDCINQMNGKTMNPENMNKFHDCMMKNMPAKMASSPMHKAMMEHMNTCSSKMTGKIMDANTVLEMHNCMMQDLMEDGK